MHNATFTIAFVIYRALLHCGKEKIKALSVFQNQMYSDTEGIHTWCQPWTLFAMTKLPWTSRSQTLTKITQNSYLESKEVFAHNKKRHFCGPLFFNPSRS